MRYAGSSAVEQLMNRISAAVFSPKPTVVHGAAACAEDSLQPMNVMRPLYRPAGSQRVALLNAEQSTLETSALAGVAKINPVRLLAFSKVAPTIAALELVLPPKTTVELAEAVTFTAGLLHNVYPLVPFRVIELFAAIVTAHP